MFNKLTSFLINIFFFLFAFILANVLKPDFTLEVFEERFLIMSCICLMISFFMFILYGIMFIFKNEYLLKIYNSDDITREMKLLISCFKFLFISSFILFFIAIFPYLDDELNEFSYTNYIDGFTILGLLLFILCCKKIFLTLRRIKFSLELLSKIFN